MKVSLVALLLLAACGQGNTSSPTKDEPPPSAITKTTDVGPVVARVSLAPEAPRVGDVLTLTLEVEAELTTTVELPPFGEALGRFSVLKFTPRHEQRPAGKRTDVQIYTLQAPGSGRQRIPQLRIEYKVGDEPVRELLTDEIPVVIESVVPGGEIAGELSTVPAALDETPGYAWWLWPAAIAALLAAIVAAGAALRARRREKERQLQLGAFDRALGRLRALEQHGIPDEGSVDAWYVELSGIVRRYLEERLRIRAPELTTEEFLQSARGNRELDESVRELLSQFLATCDRVKFAAYRPSEDESSANLVLARDILTTQEESIRRREAAALAKEAA